MGAIKLRMKVYTHSSSFVKHALTGVVKTYDFFRAIDFWVSRSPGPRRVAQNARHPAGGDRKGRAGLDPTVFINAKGQNP
jgi:hypothetical protein